MHVQPVRCLAQARNDTIRFLLHFAVPGQVPKLKNQQVSGDFLNNDLVQ